MATVNMINVTRSQTSGGMLGTMLYCCRKDKTEYQGRRLVTGVNCFGGDAYREFMNTKQLYGKTKGRMFYHMVQSFHKNEKILPDTAHEIALKLAQELQGYEILVATHVDREHIHSHFIINSVSADTGYKYRSNPEEIQRLRMVSDKLCMEYGLSVLPPKKEKEKVQRISSREYRSIIKGESWKMRLIVDIEDAMKLARSKEHFMVLMEAEGYQVRWTDSRKYITYTTPDGNQCRDIKLHEVKFTKEVMEHEFRIRADALAGYERQIPFQQRNGCGSSSLCHSDREKLDSAAGHVFHTGTDADHDPDGYEKAGHTGDQGGYPQLSAESTGAAHRLYGGNENDFRAVPADDGGNSEGFRQADGERGADHGETGWENERAVFEESLRGHRENGAQAGHTVLDIPDPIGGPASAVSGAAHLLADVGNIISDDSEDEEERRKRIQAEQNAADIGAVLGIAIGAAIALNEQAERSAEQHNEPELKQAV